MNTRWMECDYLNGPLFVAWCRDVGVLPPEGDYQGGHHHDPSVQRRVWDWTHGKQTLNVYSADTLLTLAGWHISQVPDDLWIDKPPHKTPVRVDDNAKRDAVSRVLEGGQGPTEVARTLGVHPRTIAGWCKSMRLKAATA